MRQLSAYHELKGLDRAQQDAANAAFDEFIGLADQAQWVEAILIPLLAGIVTLLTWRKTLPLSVIEIVVIAAGYAAGVMWRVHSTDVGPQTVVGIVLLAATLGLGYSPLISGRRDQPLSRGL